MIENYCVRTFCLHEFRKWRQFAMEKSHVWRLRRIWSSYRNPTQSCCNLFFISHLIHKYRLTHLPLVPHICVSESGQHGLSPFRRQVIIWTNAGILSIRPLGTNFSEILIKIRNVSFTKMHLKISSTTRWLYCPGGDELRWYYSTKRE